jgi:CDP-diacylglycerol--serine O-phosphatidyltransferase
MRPEPGETREPRRRRGIYLLPNLFTTAGLFAGFYAIVAAIWGRYAEAAIAIFVAMIMDGIDGRVARMTNTQSAFGVEYDSLSDMVSFGVAPALVMYQWALKGMSTAVWPWAKIGWLAAFIYSAGAALRLARFNTQSGMGDRRYFKGLASPAAAAVVAGMVWVAADLGLNGTDLKIPAMLITVIVGLLMVSNLRYPSFKHLDLNHRVPFVWILVVVLVFVMTSLDPPKVVFAAAVVYALSGPVLTIWLFRRRRFERGRGRTRSPSEGE